VLRCERQGVISFAVRLSNLPAKPTGRYVLVRAVCALPRYSLNRWPSRRIVVAVAGDNFEVICEIEPATRPDLMHVRHQIGVLSRVASAFLIPDNHIGRATVSSIAVAREVALMGGQSIACLNARDRNVLGFRRDLLTAAAYGVDQLLLVYGDRPETGARSDDLTVRSMIGEARQFSTNQPTDTRPLRLGVTSRLVPLPAWKREADFVFAQVSFSVQSLLDWRASLRFEGPVYAGVIVVSSAPMARKLSADIPELAVPEAIIRRLEGDPDAGIDLACDLISQIRESAAFSGVHLIPITRYREMAARLDERR
jgi:methylenetetrahydrofolate reductase (NADPH)